MNPFVVIVAGLVWAAAWSLLGRYLRPNLSLADKAALRAARAERKGRTR
jgi:hypothetical protein